MYDDGAFKIFCAVIAVIVCLCISLGGCSDSSYQDTSPPHLTEPASPSRVKAGALTEVERLRVDNTFTRFIKVYDSEHNIVCYLFSRDGSAMECFQLDSE